MQEKLQTASDCGVGLIALLGELARSVAAFLDRESLQRFLDFHLFEGRNDDANGFVRVHSHGCNCETDLTVTLFEDSDRIRRELSELMPLIASERVVVYRVAVAEELHSIEREFQSA